MRLWEVELVAWTGLPEHPALLAAVRAYLPVAYWPGRVRRRSRGGVSRSLRAVNVPLGRWVCHELHLRGSRPTWSQVHTWLEERVRQELQGALNACAAGVSARRGQVTVVLLLADLRDDRTGETADAGTGRWHTA